MLLLSYSRDALDYLTALDAKQYRQVNNKILLLIQNARPHDSLALQGYDGLFRADIGEFRIVYRYDATVLFVALIARRNDDQVYKQLSRK